MNRVEVIRTLYLGGQAAIGAEVVGIVGITLTLLNSKLMTLVMGNDPYEGFTTALVQYEKSNLVYSFAMALIILVPTVAMLLVVWAWHLYFASEGVHLMNWVATSIALVGASLMLASFGVSTWGLGLAYDAMQAGHVQKSEMYIGFAAGQGIQIAGTLILYVLYPMLLSLASWQKGLLPKWFVVLALLMTFFNDAHLVVGVDHMAIAMPAQIVTVLSPFVMGVVLLRKAQSLTDQWQRERYTTTVPTGEEATTFILTTPKTPPKQG